MTMRRIVLIGDFQVRAMARLYRRFVAVRTGERVTYIPFAIRGQDAAAQEILRANVVVEQTGIAPTALAPGCHKVPIPFVAAAFLWPFAGAAHPHNASCAFHPNGPYPREMGDRYLNRLLAKGLAAEDALACYRDLDVARETDLEGLLAAGLARQRARDEATGYRIVDTIEVRFRSEPLFLSPTHPDGRIIRLLAEQLFRRLDAHPADIQRMRQAVARSPFHAEALPVHPAVSRHFGLRWAGPRRRYRLLHEGAFTFEQYVLRYMRYEWNEALAEGLVLARSQDLTTAEARLNEALARSPGSAAGHDALRHVLEKQERWAEALAAGEQAAQADPDNATYRFGVAKLLRRLGRLTEAEAMLRTAIALEPGDPTPMVLMVEMLRQQGLTDAAAALGIEALGLAPYDSAARRAVEGLAL